MGRFKKFLGKVSVKIEDEVFNLNKLTVEDIQKIVDLSKTKENEIINGVKVVSDIFEKNYSVEEGEDAEEHRKEIEWFVTKNYTSLITEIIIALGWTTQEKIDEEVKNATEKKN